MSKDWLVHSQYSGSITEKAMEEQMIRCDGSQTFWSQESFTLLKGPQGVLLM